jgi:hypothetical protein
MGGRQGTAAVVAVSFCSVVIFFFLTFSLANQTCAEQLRRDSLVPINSEMKRDVMLVPVVSILILPEQTALLPGKSDHVEKPIPQSIHGPTTWYRGSTGHPNAVRSMQAARIALRRPL